MLLNLVDERMIYHILIQFVWVVGLGFEAQQLSSLSEATAELHSELRTIVQLCQLPYSYILHATVINGLPFNP
jgi:hypothetical protein